MTKSWIIGLLAVLVIMVSFTERPFAKDTLIIGISQFPRNFNPNIESMLAKSYVLAMTRRPLTVYDANWKLQCLLCVDLPDLATDTAKRETTADGKPGIAVT